ncbi:hypothetical protein GCM10010341_21750 [Streptomyces noursei]|nr:hypothetical protein GCM10010341_21750 [Streptomyces noursei]
MTDHIQTIFEMLLRALLPARGRHRAALVRPAQPRAKGPAVPPLGVRTRHHSVPLCGEDSALVRPFVLTPSEWRAARVQKVRQCTPWPAIHGVNAGPHWCLPQVRRVRTEETSTARVAA